MRIAIITCGSKKKSYPCAAYKMYEDGIFFNKMKTYVENVYDEYYILSGKYGLLEPTQVIEPYGDVVFFAQKIFKNRGLKPQSKSYKIEWAIKVGKQLNQISGNIDLWIGLLYYNPIKKYLPNNIRRVQVNSHSGINKMKGMLTQISTLDISVEEMINQQLLKVDL